MPNKLQRQCSRLTPTCAVNVWQKQTELFKGIRAQIHLHSDVIHHMKLVRAAQRASLISCLLIRLQCWVFSSRCTRPVQVAEGMSAFTLVWVGLCVFITLWLCAGVLYEVPAGTFFPPWVSIQALCVLLRWTLILVVFPLPHMFSSSTTRHSLLSVSVSYSKKPHMGLCHFLGRPLLCRSAWWPHSCQVALPA